MLAKKIKPIEEAKPEIPACAFTVLIQPNGKLSYSVTPSEVPADLIISALDTILTNLMRQRREAQANLDSQPKEVTDA